jgi:hypothetical protein
MKKYDLAEIIAQCEESGAKIYTATLEGDYKTNNREGAKLTKIFKRFEKNPDMARECIPELLKSSNVHVRTEGAAYCLSLNIFVEEGKAALQEIADNEENGIFGFNAEMILKVYAERGYIKIYAKQQVNIPN